MSDGSTILSLLTSLTEKVDNLAQDVAVLKDRRSDNIDQNERIEKCCDRVDKLERENVARNARAKLLAGFAAAGGTIGGASVIELLKLFGG